MRLKYRFIVRNNLPLLGLILPIAAQPLRAASITWANTGTDFNAGASWVGGVAPGAADIATFTGARVTNPVLSGAATVQGLAFSNATASAYSISGSTLTLGSGGIDASAVTSGTNTISSPLTLAAGGETWLSGTGSTLALNPSSFSRLTGAAVTIDKTASAGTVSSTTLGNTNGILGRWAMVRSAGTSANNSADGDTYATVSGGSIVPYTGATPFTGVAGVFGGVPSGGDGTANYDVNGTGNFATFGLGRNLNTIRYTGGGATQPSNTNSGSTSAGDVLTINGVLNAGTGTLVLGGPGGTNNFGISPQIGAANDLVLVPMTADITVRGRIRESAATGGALTVAGNQTVTLTNAIGAASTDSSYTGQTTIAGGTLNVAGTHNINTTSGITINGANAKYLHTSSVASTRDISLQRGILDGTGTVGAVTVADNTAAVVANGNGGTVPLTVGSLTFSGDATVNLNRNGATPLQVSGTLATTPANGQVVLNVPGALPNGLVNLVSFGSFTGSAADFTANFTGLGGRQVAGAPQVDGTNIAVNITGESIVWSGVSDSVWETAATGNHAGPNNWARKAVSSPTNFWASDSVEFNDTYNVGGGAIAVTRSYVMVSSDVSPISTIFNNNSVAYVIDSFGNGIASGSLTKNGTATTTLVGPHTYTGTTTINSGTLKLGDDTFDGTIANTSGVTNNGTLRYYWASDHTAPYPISGSGALVKEGTGTLTLTGANSSTGSTTITEGAITVTGGGGLGTGPLSVAAGANLNLNKTIALAQTATGGGTITNFAGTTTISGDFSGRSGTFRHGSATSSTLLASTTATSANVAYEITVGNAISQGILANVTTGDNSFPLGSLAGVANSLVRNAGAVTGTTTLQIGNLGTDTEFAGTIGGGGGTLALTKVGAGTLTLSGPSTYNGATQVNQGTLAFSNSVHALGSSAFTVANSAGLRVKTPAAGSTPLTTGSLTLGASNLTFDFNTLSPAVTQIATGALTVNGPVNLSILNGNAIGTGTYKLIDYTTLSGTGSFPGGSINVGNRATATIVNNVIDTSIDLQVTADTPKWTGLDNGQWVAGATGASKNWKLAVAGTATDYLNGDTVLFDDSAAGTKGVVINSADVNPTSTTFNTATIAYSLSGAFGIASGSLTKNGTGSVTVTTTNTYPGPTTINAGTLQLGNGTVDGTIANTSSVTNNGTLAYNWAGDRTAGYVISGTGNLTKAGAGNLTVTGNNTYSGGTSLAGGSLTLAGAGTLGTGPIAVGAGTSLNINKNLPIANTVTGSGNIVNAGTTTVTGDFSGFSGTFTHNSTVVSVAFNNAAATSQNAAYHVASEQGAAQGMLAGGAGDYTLKMGALSGVANSLVRGGNTVSGITTLEVGNLGTHTGFAGSINNGATKTIALSKVGAGTLTLSGANNYTGSTIVFGGALSVTGSLASGSVVTVAAGGKLMGTGTVAGTVIASGTVAPGTSTGTLTTGPATLTGTLAIEVDGANFDQLVSSGNIDFSGATLTVTDLGGGFAGPYVIAEGTTITGTFANVPAGYTVNIVNGGAGQQAVLTATGGGYDAWKSNVGNQSADQDFNGDGVENGIAYFMNNTGRITLPGMVGGAVTWTNGGNIPASAYGSQFVVQTSPNLTTWNDVPAGSLISNTDGPGGSLTYTLPTGQGKLFVRLMVTPN